MTKLKFRSDINALRAIAVIGVVLYHFKVPYFQGGFSGVDIFFVISGYLMSKIIITDISQAKLSLVNFYGKRLKRIVPALLCMIAIVSIVGFFLSLPDDYSFNSKSGFYSLLFISNIYYWKHSGYFDSSSETNTFLHTWSLSVEWQFYIIYPILLLILYKVVKQQKQFRIIFTLLTALFTVASFFATKYDNMLSFYLFPTRAWEMMAGGVALLIEPLFVNLKLKKIYVTIGYLILLGGMTLLNHNMSWPFFHTLIPVIATLIIIALNADDIRSIKVDILQYIGKISYSLYLWHWPIYVFFFYLGASVNWLSISLMIILATVLSILSYTFIEKKRFESNWKIIVNTSVLAIITISLSVTKPNRLLFNKEALQLASFNKTHQNERNRQFDHGCCFLSVMHDGGKQFESEKCLKISPNKNNYILIGDSHAAQFSQSIKEVFEKNNSHLIQATVTRCMPILADNGNKTCHDIIDYVYNDFIPKNKSSLDGVIICANWINYGGDKDTLIKELIKTVNYIKKLNIDVKIIGQNEAYTIPFPIIKAKEIQYGLTLLDRFKDQNAFDINELLKKSLKDSYIDIMNNGTVPPNDIDNTPYMFDENHYTKYGTDLILNKLTRSKGWESMFQKKH